MRPHAETDSAHAAGRCRGRGSGALSFLAVALAIKACTCGATAPKSPSPVPTMRNPACGIERMAPLGKALAEMYHWQLPVESIVWTDDDVHTYADVIRTKTVHDGTGFYRTLLEGHQFCTLWLGPETAQGQVMPSVIAFVDPDRSVLLAYSIEM